MSLQTLALIALVLAALPCGLFLLNLLVYRPLPRSSRREEAHPESPRVELDPPYVGRYGVSVLIPARNEEQNIRATLDAALANRGCRFEIVVLDDHSTDRTAEMVSELAARDPRVRLETAPPLPAGWCGKQHACHMLAKLAHHSLLVFIDADVRLAPDALARLADLMQTSESGGSIVERGSVLDCSGPPPLSMAHEDCDASQRARGLAHSKTSRTFERRVNRQSQIVNRPALASGVPRQELGTFSERLLIPLIHFILMGFLPMHAMRRTRLPSMSAGCGQLFIARRNAYEQCGGHAMLRDSLHDGIKLPRVFRQAGFATDLFDATDLATCRMYHTNADTWRGLGKNATEGLADPVTILPMTALLLGGQVLPFVLLALAPMLSSSGLTLAALAAVIAYVPRLLAVRLFRQPLGGALLHPLGVIALLAIQWNALFRHLAGKPSVWKGRSYSVAEPARVA